MNIEDKKTIDKIKLQLLIKEYITPELTPEATALKIELINTLLNNKVTYINVISYYYDILNAQDK